MTYKTGDEMKLIELIVKEVKREDIQIDSFYFIQDTAALLVEARAVNKNFKRGGVAWYVPNDLVNATTKLTMVADDSPAVIIGRDELMAAYDAAEKPSESENIINDDSFGESERYNRGNIECIDIIREMVSDKSGEEAFCVGNITKYLYRYKSKGGLKDVIKARNYLNQMIKGMEDE